MGNLLAPLCLAALLLLNACPPETPDAAQGTGLAGILVPADLMGMVHAGSRFDRVQDEYDLLDELGVVWILKDFSWSGIQPGKDAWNLDAYKTYADNGKARGKKILALLDYDVGWIHDGTYDDDPHTDGKSHEYISKKEIPLFCEYVKKTARHYKDRVDAWCIWNEPNLQPRFWTGTKEEFFALTKAAAAAIREVNPGAVVVGGAFNTLANEAWIRGIFESGAMDQIDAIAYHPYTPGYLGAEAVYNNFKALVAEYGFEDKIWITEVGYPTQGSYGTEVPEDHIPDMMIKTVIPLLAGNAKHIFWYHLFDPPSNRQDPEDSEDWFGLVKDDFEKKKGADAYSLVSKHIPGKTYYSLLPERSGIPDSIRAYYFEGNDGKHTLIIWNDDPVSDKQVTVTLPGSGGKTYDAQSGEPAAIGETATVTLRSRFSPNPNLGFFTWENTDAAKPPRISG
ncbi:MAG: hypothetical protein LBD55_05560 [Treponema sp.]|jgi:hypothetical protein|nr:hypothetical protein [Treponema sp.]